MRRYERNPLFKLYHDFFADARGKSFRRRFFGVAPKNADFPICTSVAKFFLPLTLFLGVLHKMRFAYLRDRSTAECRSIPSTRSHNYPYICGNILVSPCFLVEIKVIPRYEQHPLLELYHDFFAHARSKSFRRRFFFGASQNVDALIDGKILA